MKMDYKKFIAIFIIFGVFIVSITGVSAGLFDFLSNSTDSEVSEPVTLDDAVIKESVQLKYTKPVKSTSYAYYYEDSGEYAEAAYWAPWSFKATFKFDVEKLFKWDCRDNSNYTLDMFKKDLKYIVKHDDVRINDVYANDDNFAEEHLQINNSAVTSSLNNDSSVLTIKVDYKFEEYKSKYIKEKINAIKNATSVNVDLTLYKDMNHNFTTGSHDINIDLDNIPVKPKKMSS